MFRLFHWRCWHRRLSFPLTLDSDRARGGAARPHVVCLRCGREFWYDWERMRRGAERKPLAPSFPPPRRAA